MLKVKTLTMKIYELSVCVVELLQMNVDQNYEGNTSRGVAPSVVYVANNKYFKFLVPHSVVLALFLSHAFRE